MGWAVRCGAVLGWAMLAAEAQAGWVLAREFDFSRGDKLDAAAWRVERGFQRNREAQYYTDNNISVQGGALVFEAKKQAMGGAAYTSGSIVLREPVHFGRIEIVARSPSGKGVWPAVWLLREGENDYGEIDAYEFVGKHPGTVFGAVHFGRTSKTRLHRGGSIVVPGFEGSWRTHTLDWTPARIAMAVDGQPVFSFDPRDAAQGGIDPLRQPMFLHVNLALGGSWGGPIDDKVLPARFEIARIRIYKWEEGDAPARETEAPRWGR